MADIPFLSTESPVPTEYRGVSFAAWLDVFLEMALVLAKMGEDYKGYSYAKINAALDCVVWYHEPESMVQIHVCYFTCALALNDAATMSNVVARWFMRQLSFCSDAYRLFSTLNLVYEQPAEKGGKDAQLQHATWRLGPSQKFLFRQLKAVDALLPEDYNDDGLDGPVPNYMREEGKKLEKEGREESRAIGGHPKLDEAAKPTEMDVVLLALYGQILYAGGSFPSALSYYYRAYALDPKNPMLLLSIALSYTHQMFKRQNENRHMYLMQGLAFFEEYSECRMGQCTKENGEKEKLVKMEIEFNRARIWHMLGLANLAVSGYGKVLGSNTAGRHPRAGDEAVDAVKVTDTLREDFSREAAYAMQTAYAMSGDLDAAMDITEKWLVIE